MCLGGLWESGAVHRDRLDFCGPNERLARVSARMRKGSPTDDDRAYGRAPTNLGDALPRNHAAEIIVARFMLARPIVKQQQLPRRRIVTAPVSRFVHRRVVKKRSD